MRQSFRERRQHLHRGLFMPRLATMFLMLAILGLVFVQLRNPNNWRFFGSRDEEPELVSQKISARSTGFSRKADEEPPEGGTSSAEPYTGDSSNAGTDLDPKEMEKIKPLLDTFYDGSLESMPAEQPAYFQVLSWVDHQSTAAMRKRATRAFFYDTLVKSPDTMRLQLLEVKLSVRQIVPVMGKPKDGRPQPLLTRDGKEIYEVRGVSLESGSNFYFGMVTDLPPGTPVGTLMNENAWLVGYFFKVQGYISQQQQLDFEASRTKKPVPLKAPLFIGRLAWITQPTTTFATNTPVWVLASVGGTAIVLVLAWVYWASRQRPHASVPRISANSSIDPDALPVDRWLDQAQSGKIAQDGVSELAYSEGAVLDLEDVGGRYVGNTRSKNRESNIEDRPGNGDSRS
jgi:hypothetical protein